MPYLECQPAVPCFLLGDAQALQKQPQQSLHLWMAGWRAVTPTLFGEPHQQMYAGCCLPPVTTIRLMNITELWIDQQTMTGTGTCGLMGLAIGQASV